MYERFTDRARRAIQLANQEAQRFNHEYLDTEHILLGLIKEGTGVAANVLKNLNVNLRMIRIEVEKTVPPGPDPMTRGNLPQTPRVQKLVEYAMDEARNLNHNYVGTEHLLLGLLREQEGVAAQILLNVGLKLDDVRAEVANVLGCCLVSGESGAAEHESNTGAAPHTGLQRFTTQALEDARQMKNISRTLNVIVVLIGCLLAVSGYGFYQLTAPSFEYDAEWRKQRDRTRAQMDDFDRQTQRVDINLAKQQEQNQRVDRLLDKWNEQARRQDAILDAEEKQHGLPK